jgi:hypothetical protein
MFSEYHPGGGEGGRGEVEGGRREMEGERWKGERKGGEVL